MAGSMYNMVSAQQILLQYVLVTCNEKDSDMVLNLTYDGALSLLQQAGIQITEWCDEYDEED